MRRLFRVRAGRRTIECVERGKGEGKKEKKGKREEEKKKKTRVGETPVVSVGSHAKGRLLQSGPSRSEAAPAGAAQNLSQKR